MLPPCAINFLPKISAIKCNGGRGIRFDPSATRISPSHSPNGNKRKFALSLTIEPDGNRELYICVGRTKIIELCVCAKTVGRAIKVSGWNCGERENGAAARECVIKRERERVCR